MLILLAGVGLKGKSKKTLTELFQVPEEKTKFLATVGSNTACWGLSQSEKAGYKYPNPECSFIHFG